MTSDRIAAFGVEYFSREDRHTEERDRQGRRVGAGVLRCEADFVVLADDAETPPAAVIYRFARGRFSDGRHYGFKPSSLRNGASYGAIQPVRWFETAADREADIEKYFRESAKRARLRRAIG